MDAIQEAISTTSNVLNEFDSLRPHEIYMLVRRRIETSGLSKAAQAAQHWTIQVVWRTLIHGALRAAGNMQPYQRRIYLQYRCDMPEYEQLKAGSSAALVDSGLSMATETVSAVEVESDGEVKSSNESDQVVTPFEVSGGSSGRIDYSKVVRDFGCSLVDQQLVERIERLTGCTAHRLLRRHVFFAHRDLHRILDAFEHSGPRSFYLYTGRGPSSEALHIGHLIPFLFTKWLQDAFGVPLVIQLTDDEKFLWKNMSISEASRLARENAKDIIALGFDPKNTFIFRDTEYMGGSFYQNCIEFARHVTFSHARNTFGFSNDSNIGQIGFPPVQAAPSFPDSFPHLFGSQRKRYRCLIPCAIDQDPYFRLTRDVCGKMKGHKPALIESSFFPGLQGEGTKMSASEANNAVYVTDTAKQIKTKINRYAFSGGQDTAEEQRKYGAKDVEADVSIKWLTFLMEDDEELARMKEQYRSGEMLTGQVKERLIGLLQEFVQEHQRRKSEMTDEYIDSFFDVAEKQSDQLFGGRDE